MERKERGRVYIYIHSTPYEEEAERRREDEEGDD